MTARIRLPPENTTGRMLGTLSADEYRALGKPKRSNKYGVAPVEQRTVDGIVFASAAEAKRFCELKLLERGGFIRDLERQTRFTFLYEGKPIFDYVSDFDYWEGCTYVVEDSKGFQTPVFRLKRKLIEAQFKMKIRLVP